MYTEQFYEYILYSNIMNTNYFVCKKYFILYSIQYMNIFCEYKNTSIKIGKSAGQNFVNDI